MKMSNPAMEDFLDEAFETESGFEAISSFAPLLKLVLADEKLRDKFDVSPCEDYGERIRKNLAEMFGKEFLLNEISELKKRISLLERFAEILEDGEAHIPKEASSAKEEVVEAVPESRVSSVTESENAKKEEKEEPKDANEKESVSIGNKYVTVYLDGEVRTYPPYLSFFDPSDGEKAKRYGAIRYEGMYVVPKKLDDAFRVVKASDEVSPEARRSMERFYLKYAKEKDE